MEALGCTRRYINNIIKMNLDTNTAHLLEQSIVDLTPLEQSNRKLAIKLEELESCFVKSIWFDVAPLLPSFTERKDAVKEVHKLIKQGMEGRQIATIISGLPGTGKTSLAQYYCYEYGEVYENNVAWIQADTLERLKSSLNRIGQCLKIIDEQGYEEEKSVPLLVSRIYKFFADRTCLFVLDNAADAQFILKCLPQNLPLGIKNPVILITSKSSNWGERFLEKKIEKLTEAESKELVFKSLPEELLDDQEKTLLLLKLLNGYPLAHQQAIAYMIYSMITVTVYVEIFQQIGNKHQLLDVPSNDTLYPGTVATSLLLIFDAIDAV